MIHKKTVANGLVFPIVLWAFISHRSTTLLTKCKHLVSQRGVVVFSVLCFFISISHSQAQTLAIDTTLAGRYLEAGDSLYGKAQFDSAIHYYEEASNLYQAYGVWEGSIQAQNRQGDAVGRQGKYEQGVKVLQEALGLGLKYLGKESLSVADSYSYVGLIYKKMKKYDQAKSYYEKALSIYIKQLGEEHLEVARVYNNMGNIYWALGQYNLGQEYHQKVLSIRVKQLGEEHLEVARIHSNIGNNYWRLGQYKPALAHCQKALDICINKLGENHLYVAQSFNSVGAVYWLLGQYDQAMDHYQKSLSISISKLGENHIDVTNTYHNIGLTYHSLGQYDQALKYTQKALNIHINRLGNKHPNIANSYETVGGIYEELGQYEQSLNYYQKALNIKKEALGEEHPDISDTYHNIGLIHWKWGQYERALDYYQKALDTSIKQLGEEHPGIATSYNNMGIVFTELGQYDQALGYTQKALSIQINYLGEEHPSVTYSYGNMGAIYKELGQYDKALFYYKKALDIKKKAVGETHPAIAGYYNSIGAIYYEQSLYERSLEYYQKALLCNVPGFTDNTITSNPPLGKYLSGPILLTSLIRKARALAELTATDPTGWDPLRLSVETYMTCDTLVNQLRHASFKESDKITLGQEVSEVYTGAMQTLLTLMKKENEANDNLLALAFHMSEKNKAVVLSEALQEHTAKNFAGIPDSLLEQEKVLKEQQASYHQKLTNKLDSIVRLNYENKLFQIQQQQEALITQLEQQYPNYYQLKYEVSTASIAHIQQNLNEKSALIEYFVSDSTLYTFIISAENAHVQELPLPANFGTTVQQLRKMLTSYPDQTAEQGRRMYADTAYQLYMWLLEKPLSLLPATVEKLVIIPDGILNYLSFEALVTDLPKADDQNGIDFSKLAYLVKDFQVSYATSATLWTKAKAYHKTTTEKPTSKYAFGGFAPEYQQLLADSTMPKMMAQLVRTGEMPLPGAKAEVQDIAEVTSGHAWTGTEAVEQAFKQKASEYNVLHLAMHALVNDEDPMQSSFVFSPSQDSTEDGYLYASEIYTMQINANLAVLSACNSGTGSMKKGEGIMSLSRAFMYAGCPTQIMSLWQVSDFSSKKIMVDFYKGLTKNKAVDEALRDAQLKYLVEIGHPTYSHPFFWASFIPVGAMEPIDMDSGNNKIWWIMVVALGGILLVVLLIRRHKGKVIPI